MCLNDTKGANVYLKHFHSSKFRVIDVYTMNEEKYITIKELAELKSVSTRAIISMFIRCQANFCAERIELL